MGEPKVIKFSYPELAALMVKQQGIKDGYWGIYVRFGISALNMSDNETSAYPAAVVPLLEMGLQQFDSANPLAVDAAEVWKK